MITLAFAIALVPLLAQVSHDQPFVPTRAVCFRAELGPKSTTQKPIYKKAVLFSTRDQKECVAKNTKLAALCDAHARTQYQGEFKSLWRSLWERDRLLSGSIQSSCAEKIGLVVDVTTDMNKQGKAKEEIGGWH